jgi:hypothetical protein
MKRFLVTLVVIILAVSVGFGVFYLVKDDEKISLKAHTVYKDAGESFELSLDMENPNSYTTIEVKSSDENVVKVIDSEVEKKEGIAKGVFAAVAGGNAKVVFKTNNAKFRNIGCDVIVCDGSLAYPYRIDNAEELQRIGASNEEIYTADKNYILTNNIDLGALEAFSPISVLSGSFDGNGYTISNMVINGDQLASIGLFRTVTETGLVKNLKIDGAVITANNNNTNIGVIAGINKGQVQLCEIKSATIMGSSANAIVGGAVGVNESKNEYTSRRVARVDRLSANVAFGSEELGALGTIGGLVGKNVGGIVINSYTTGNAFVKDATYFGGVVGSNNALNISGSGTGYTGVLGGNIKDCYSRVVIDQESTAKMGYILAANSDKDSANKIVGNYYESATELKGMGSKDITYGEIVQNGTTNAASGNLLRSLTQLVSYKYYERQIKVVDGKISIEWDKSSEKAYLWDNFQVWTSNKNINDGYPILTFEDVYVNDNFENSAEIDLVDTLGELRDIRNNLSGTYVISENINLSLGGEWEPIGTKEKPFTGTLIAADGLANGVTLSCLTITSSTYDYAGLFGVIGNGAYIKGITMADVKITGNNKFVGAIAGQNSGTIVDCNLVSGEIAATNAAGGIVGENKGHIADVNVTTAENSAIVITKLKGSKDDYNYGAGGITGINFSNITINNYGSYVEGCVYVTSTSHTNLGGIAGQNNGMIAEAYVIMKAGSDASQKYGVVSTSTGNLGGIVGYSTGFVLNVYASAKVSAETGDNSYVGGIVGSLNASKPLSNDDKAPIQGAVVRDSYISGYMSGGIVGILTTEYEVKLDVQKADFNFNGAQYPANIDNSVRGTVENVGVETGVTLEGKYSGGIVGTLSKGIVKNAYTKAMLSADENAGIVYSISYNASTKEGGVIFKVYSTAVHKQGTSYAVSTSEINNNWNLGLFVGEDSKNRTVGFVIDYYYEGSSSLKNPQTPNPLQGVFELVNRQDLVHNSRTANEMKSKSLWSGVLPEAVWTIQDGSLPTINICEIIKSGV